MDQDLQDLLALWRGDHDSGEGRREALLARLREDDSFRRAFVEEIRLLGMLKAVQSAEPRWLRLEDEIGWTARQREEVEALAERVVHEGKRRLRIRRLARWGAALAAAVVVAGALVLAFRPGARAPEPPSEAAHAGMEIATAIKVEDIRWEPGEGATPGEGTVVTSGRLRLASGRLTLAFFSGVALTVEGPADLELRAADRVFCHYGKLRARVPRGAEGFTVLTAGYEVVDMGTEFALNLEPGGKSRVMVFEGEAGVSVLGKDGRSVGGALLERQRSVEVDPGVGRIQDVAPQPDDFVELGEFVPPPLRLDPGYAEAILTAKPWGYWRFETLVNDTVPNEIAGRPGLKATGSVNIEPSTDGNHAARFRHDDHAQAFLMDGVWTPPRSEGYAIEVWVQADIPTPKAQGRSALVGLIDREDGQSENHLAYLELTARGRRSPHEPCTVRFLDRWPAATSGGADVFSRRTVVTTLWRHVVGQKNGDTLELYVDGELVGTSPARLNAQAPEDAATTACRLFVGRLKQRSLPPFESEIRAFEGLLDELAVYDRPLTPEEIRRHAHLGNRAAP
ncbi:MAG TPA: LamG domain-containing protein [Gemmataceae bacterium]|nr:LamG domain-containing protein [Gemmataceae bacterium]